MAAAQLATLRPGGDTEHGGEDVVHMVDMAADIGGGAVDGGRS